MPLLYDIKYSLKRRKVNLMYSFHPLIPLSKDWGKYPKRKPIKKDGLVKTAEPVKNGETKPQRVLVGRTSKESLVGCYKFKNHPDKVLVIEHRGRMEGERAGEGSRKIQEEVGNGGGGGGREFEKGERGKEDEPPKYEDASGEKAMGGRFVGRESSVYPRSAGRDDGGVGAFDAVKIKIFK